MRLVLFDINYLYRWRTTIFLILILIMMKDESWKIKTKFPLSLAFSLARWQNKSFTFPFHFFGWSKWPKKDYITDCNHITYQYQTNHQDGNIWLRTTTTINCVVEFLVDFIQCLKWAGPEGPTWGL